jgi:hypothetical protein
MQTCPPGYQPYADATFESYAFGPCGCGSVKGGVDCAVKPGMPLTIFSGTGCSGNSETIPGDGSCTPLTTAAQSVQYTPTMPGMCDLASAAPQPGQSMLVCCKAVP